MEHCIAPRNEADTSEADRKFDMPKGLTKRASKLLYIMSGFPEISLVKHALLVNNKNIMSVESFLKNVYSSKRTSDKSKIILGFLQKIPRAQLGRGNAQVFKKIRRIPKKSINNRINLKF